MATKNKNRLGNITKIESEYVISQEKKIARQARQKKQIRRRAVVLFSFFTIALLVAFYYKYTQEQLLASKIEKNQQLNLELKKQEKKQAAYQQELTNLNDPDYMAKIARSQYFLSKDGEIIFEFPDEDERDHEKANEEKSENKKESENIQD